MTLRYPTTAVFFGVERSKLKFRVNSEPYEWFECLLALGCFADRYCCLLVAVCSVRVLADSDIMQDFLASSEDNIVSVLCCCRCDVLVNGRLID